MSQYTLILHDAKDSSEQGRDALKTVLESQLHISKDSLNTIFSSLPAILKQDLNKDQADNYLLVFEKLGANVELLAQDDSDFDVIQLSDDEPDTLTLHSQLSETPSSQSEMPKDFGTLASELEKDLAQLEGKSLEQESSLGALSENEDNSSSSSEIDSLTKELEAELDELNAIEEAQTQPKSAAKIDKELLSFVEEKDLIPEEEDKVIEAYNRDELAQAAKELAEASEEQENLNNSSYDLSSELSKELEKNTGEEAGEILMEDLVATSADPVVDNDSKVEQEMRDTGKSDVGNNLGEINGLGAIAPASPKTTGSHRKPSMAFRRPEAGEEVSEPDELISPTKVEPQKRSKPKKSGSFFGPAVTCALIPLVAVLGYLQFTQPKAGNTPIADKDTVKLILSKQEKFQQMKLDLEKKKLEKEEETRLVPIVAETLKEYTSTSTIDDLTIRLTLKRDVERNMVVGFSALVKQKPSKQLSNTEIVNEAKRKAWLRRYEGSFLKEAIANNDLEPISLVSEAYAYVEDGEGPGRTTSTFTVLPKYDAAEDVFTGTWELKSSGAEEYDRGSIKRMPGDLFELFFDGSFTADSSK